MSMWKTLMETKEGYAFAVSLQGMSNEVLKSFADIVVFEQNKIDDIKNGKIKYLDGNYTRDKLLVVDSLNEIVAMYVKIGDNKYEFARGLF